MIINILLVKVVGLQLRCNLREIYNFKYSCYKKKMLKINKFRIYYKQLEKDFYIINLKKVKVLNKINKFMNYKIIR